MSPRVALRGRSFFSVASAAVIIEWAACFECTEGRRNCTAGERIAAFNRELLAGARGDVYTLRRASITRPTGFSTRAPPSFWPKGLLPPAGEYAHDDRGAIEAVLSCTTLRFHRRVHLGEMRPAQPLMRPPPLFPASSPCRFVGHRRSCARHRRSGAHAVRSCSYHLLAGVGGVGKSRLSRGAGGGAATMAGGHGPRLSRGDRFPYASGPMRCDGPPHLPTSALTVLPTRGGGTLATSRPFRGSSNPRPHDGGSEASAAPLCFASVPRRLADTRPVPWSSRTAVSAPRRSALPSLRARGPVPMRCWPVQRRGARREPALHNTEHRSCTRRRAHRAAGRSGPERSALVRAYFG